MSQNIHGHEILERIVSAGGSLSLSALRSAAQAAHGADASYFTCSAHGMSFDELMGFLVRRNKIAISNDTVTVFVEALCRDSNR